MRVLVTGSKGQLGRELAKQLYKLEDKYEVVQTDIHNLDITDFEEVLRVISSRKPDVVINCAAYTNVDACEGDETLAFRINAIGARNLSVASEMINAKIVQVSTDYVFDGNGGTPKREYDETNPENSYGKSKLLGEKLVMGTNKRFFIVRTAWLYGDGNNFVRTMLELAQNKKEIDIVCDQTGCPTSTVDLANCIINLINTDNYGVYHATGEGSCSWYEFARQIFKLCGADVKLNAITTEQLNRPAKRPKYSVLDNFMLKVLGMNSFRHWEDSLLHYLKGEKAV
jgi:dTDP-4-dehydrorhamnose reductase